MKTIVIALMLVSQFASAAIFKYIDPVTEAVEYSSHPRLGEIASNSSREQREALTQLAKAFPLACKSQGAQSYCEPLPGMRIKLAEIAFDMERVDNNSGRIERYTFNLCSVWANSSVITAIKC